MYSNETIERKKYIFLSFSICEITTNFDILTTACISNIFMLILLITAKTVTAIIQVSDKDKTQVYNSITEILILEGLKSLQHTSCISDRGFAFGGFSKGAL